MDVIIYLIGYVLCYIVFRYLLVGKDDSDGWSEIGTALSFSIFSWIGVILCIIIFIIMGILWLVDRFNIKPPKWL